MDPSSCSNDGRFCGPVGINSASGPFAKLCFESSFVSKCGKAPLNCITTYAARGNCLFDAECNSRQCRNGTCASADIDFPQVVNSLSYDNYLKYMQGVTGGTMAGVPKAKCKEGMVLLKYKGKVEPYCPIPSQPGTQPVCQQTMQNLWQCSQYKNSSQPGSQKAYELCRNMEGCFAYNAQYPDGTVHPAMVKMNSFCLGVGNAAVQQSAMACTTCELGSSATCAGGSASLAPFMLAPAGGCAKNKCA